MAAARRGAPVTIPALADHLAVAHQRVADTLAGVLAGLQVDGRALDAWCAPDTPVPPPATGQAATVHSRPETTGQLITLVVRPDWAHSQGRSDIALFPIEEAIEGAHRFVDGFIGSALRP